MKGFIGDIFIILAVILAFFILAVLGNAVLTQASQNSALNQTTESNSMLLMGINTVRGFDMLLIIITFFMFLGSVMAAFMVRSHPVFFIVMIIVQLIAILVSSVIANVAFSFATNPAVSTYAENFPLSLTLLSFLPHVSLVFSAIISIVMLARPSVSPWGY
jgi:hypothetical protein